MMATWAFNELKHYQNEELRKRICHSLVSLQHIFRVQPVTYLNISNSKLASTTKAYLQPSRTSMMEPFCENI